MDKGRGYVSTILVQTGTLKTLMEYQNIALIPLTWVKLYRVNQKARGQIIKNKDLCIVIRLFFVDRKLA